jgi:hypothetical protein
MHAFGKPVSFTKSTFSGAANSNCVEVAFEGGNALVRNSRHPEGAVLEFTYGEWTAFLAGVRAGEFDWV